MQPFLEIARNYQAQLFIYRLEAPREVLLKRVLARPKPVAARTKLSKNYVLRNLDIHEKHSYDTPRATFNTVELSARQVVNRILKDVISNV